MTKLSYTGEANLPTPSTAKQRSTSCSVLQSYLCCCMLPTTLDPHNFDPYLGSNFRSVAPQIILWANDRKLPFGVPGTSRTANKKHNHCCRMESRHPRKRQEHHMVCTYMTSTLPQASEGKGLNVKCLQLHREQSSLFICQESGMPPHDEHPKECQEPQLFPYDKSPSHGPCLHPTLIHPSILC